MVIFFDGKYFVFGDCSKFIFIWEVQSCQYLYIFIGYWDVVLGLVFCRGIYQFYSIFYDCFVKVWNVVENFYVEMFFGYQDVVVVLDVLSWECCVMVGGWDGIVCVWKIFEEFQFVFYGYQGFIDCIYLINEEYMVFGVDDGFVVLWGFFKK